MELVGTAVKINSPPDESETLGPLTLSWISWFLMDLLNEGSLLWCSLFWGLGVARQLTNCFTDRYLIFCCCHKTKVAAENVEKGGVLSYIGIPDEDVPLFLASIVITLILLVVIYNVYRRHQYKQKKRRRAQINRDVRRKEWDKEKNPFDWYQRKLKKSSR